MIAPHIPAPVPPPLSPLLLPTAVPAPALGNQLLEKGRNTLSGATFKLLVIGVLTLIRRRTERPPFA
ncbi:MAG: hypothetical protein WCH61_01790, partial [bacterium]